MLFDTLSRQIPDSIPLILQAGLHANDRHRVPVGTGSQSGCQNAFESFGQQAAQWHVSVIDDMSFHRRRKNEIRIDNHAVRIERTLMK